MLSHALTLSPRCAVAAAAILLCAQAGRAQDVVTPADLANVTQQAEQAKKQARIVNLARQMREASAALREYCKTNGKFRHDEEGMIAVLRYVFPRVYLGPPKSSMYPGHTGQHCTLGNLWIGYDPEINHLEVVEDQIQVPSSWYAPADTIVMLTDGQNSFVVWAADDDGHPVPNPDTKTPLVIRETAKKE